LIGTFLTSFLFNFCSVKTIISTVGNVSSFFIKFFKRRFDFQSIFLITRKMNRLLGIHSCFKICVSQKIILSILGYDVQVVCGVSSSIEDPIDGHAWIVYNNKPILEKNENIDKYVKSFII